MCIQPYQKKRNADNFPICISLYSWWVCSSNLQPNFRLPFGAWSLIITTVLQAGGLVACIPCAADWLAWIPSPDLFLWQFWALVLPRKLVFHAQTTPAKSRCVRTDFPFESHYVLGGCAALFCNQIFVFRSTHGPSALLWLCKMVVRWYAPCAVDCLA